MALDENRLTGRIPQELGDVDGLKALSIGNNQFSGNVPWQLCELENLYTLVADCFRNACDCCSKCETTIAPTDKPTPAPTNSPTITPEPTSAPTTPEPTSSPTTPAPTRKPTSKPTVATQSPTKAPTPRPTICVPEIEYVADCIDIGQKIEVRFTNCNPRADDWIGLYNKDADLTNLGSALHWSWLCGDQNCNKSAKSGTIVFDANSIGPPNGVWPLERNDYYVYMIRRNSGGPYAAYAETGKMKIREDNC
jgi:hypothetical protein